MGSMKACPNLKKCFHNRDPQRVQIQARRKLGVKIESSEYLLEDDSQGDNDDDDESLDEEQPTPLMIEALLLSWLRGLGK